jgi:hypothetical protein
VYIVTGDQSARARTAEQATRDQIPVRLVVGVEMCHFPAALRSGTGGVHAVRALGQ